MQTWDSITRVHARQQVYNLDTCSPQHNKVSDDPKIKALNLVPDEGFTNKINIFNWVRRNWRQTATENMYGSIQITVMENANGNPTCSANSLFPTFCSSLKSHLPISTHSQVQISFYFACQLHTQKSPTIGTDGIVPQKFLVYRWIIQTVH